jgi:hypothetical protein
MAALLTAPAFGDTKKATQEHKDALIRGLTAEWGTAKVILPVSKKALPYDSNGTYDEGAWRDAVYKNGPAARPGDQVQIKKVHIDDDSIKLDFNDGTKKGSWRDRIQIGGQVNVEQQPDRPVTNAQQGLSIEIHFPDSTAHVEAADVKKILAKVLDFSGRSASEVYMETLPAPIQEGIKAKKVVVGMDREQVLLAVGNTSNKVRYTRDDVDYEEWVYGQPPGVIKFVVFKGAKVAEIKEDYAGINGSIAATPAPEK